MNCISRLFVKVILFVFVPVLGVPVLLVPARAGGQAPWLWMPKELVLHIATGENNPRNSEGDFVILDNGTVLYTYTHFFGASPDDHASACLMSRSSDDGGNTWTVNDKLEVENEGGRNVISVTTRRLTDGRVVMFYLVTESSEDCRPFMRVRNTDGSWGPRECLLTDPAYNIVNNDRVIQLSSGRLLVPVACHDYLGKSQYDYNENAHTFCLISDDGGKSWRESQYVEPTEGIVYQEPGVCELSDGRILMNIRTNGGAQYFTYSEDGGQTWGKAFKSCLDSPLSPTLIKRIPGSDELLAVGNPLLDNSDWNERAAMTIERLSPDGSTILSRKTLEHPERQVAPDWQYPAICFLDDNTALVAYFAWLQGIYIYKLKLSDL